MKRGSALPVGEPPTLPEGGGQRTRVATLPIP